jgi:AAA domain
MPQNESVQPVAPDDGLIIEVDFRDETEREAERAERERAEAEKREKAEALQRELDQAREKSERKREEAERAEREKAEAEIREREAEKRQHEELVEQILANWRSAPDRITYGGRSYAVEQWYDNRESAEEKQQQQRLDFLLKMAKKGTITNRRGQQLEGPALDRMRVRLLGTYDSIPGSQHLMSASPSSERRWLIPGLWPWGTIPMLGGNKGAGKTKLVTDLVIPLIVPGRKFLNRFEVPEVPDKDFGSGLWLVNAETPTEDLDGALRPELDHRVEGSGGSFWPAEFVHVEHLELLGGPQMFDLTDPKIYDLWFNRLIECSMCDGEDDQPPFVVIVDGLTAILGGSTSRYGEWYAKFRLLMRSLDIPNALVVVHNTMAGGHPMGGVEAAAGADGVWTYSSDNPDDPFSKRRFSVRPRIGGVAIPPTQVTLDSDGRLTLKSKQTKVDSPATPTESPSAETETTEAIEPTAAELVLDYVQRCNANGYGPTQRQVRENVAARDSEVDAATSELVENDKLEVRPRVGRGGGKSYWVTLDV